MFRKPPLKLEVTTLWDYPSQHYGDSEQGDKTYKGGNDYEIYNDSRITGHAVNSPADTIRILDEIFHLNQ